MGTRLRRALLLSQDGASETGTKPALSRWECGISSLSSARRRHPFLAVFERFRPLALEGLAPRAGIMENSCCGGRTSRRLQERVIAANQTKAAGRRQSRVGLDRLPRASPRRAAWPRFLSPEWLRGLWDGKSLLVSVDPGNCVTAVRAPWGGEEPFPEGRTFQYPALSLVSMEMAERPKQEVGFLGEGR